MNELTTRHGPEMFAKRDDLKHAIGFYCEQPICEMLNARNNFYRPSNASHITYRGSAVTAALYRELTAPGSHRHVRPAALFATDEGAAKAVEFQGYHVSANRPHKVLYKVIGHSGTKLGGGGAALGERERLYSFDAVFIVRGHEQVRTANSCFTRVLLEECSQDQARQLRDDPSVLRIP
ncbi:MAG: hypothetical protein ACRYG5_02855 [Janthinobacterium lividum]